MSQPRRNLTIPHDLLGRYLSGELTINGLAALVGASREITNRALKAQGVDTSVSASKKRRHAHRWESSKDIPAGTAYDLAARLYRQGHSLREVAGALGCNKRAVREILKRVNQEARPQWTREVFRDADGRQLDVGPFGEKLRALRKARGLSQQQAAELCGLSQSAIWQWEAGRVGPTWAALYKLVTGLGIGREDVGVEQDWPGPIPPGLLGPRRRRKRYAAPQPSAVEQSLSTPASAVGCYSYEAPDRSRSDLSWLNLGSCHKYTFDSPRFQPEPGADVPAVVFVAAG